MEVLKVLGVIYLVSVIFNALSYWRVSSIFPDEVAKMPTRGILAAVFMPGKNTLLTLTLLYVILFSKFHDKQNP